MREFTRSLPADAFGVTGRTIEGIALRWDRLYRVSDDDGRSWYREGWRFGAFARGLRATGNMHELRLDHDDVRAGRVAFAEGGDGLNFTAVVDGTELGDHVLADAAAGHFRGVSLRYSSDRQTSEGEGIYWRTRAVARELSLTMRTKAQYEDAGILAMRAMEGEEEAELARAAERAAVLALARANAAIDLDAL